MKDNFNQDGRKKYLTKRYMNLRRWTTYSELIKCVLEINPSKILEIGVGNRLVAEILEKMGYTIKVGDIDKTLNPDYLFDVRDIKISEFKNKFDLIIASQILEHIEYKEFLEVIQKLSLISKKMIITLPYCDKNDYFFSISINIPNRKSSRITLNAAKKFYSKKLPYNYNKYHKWEIGTKGFPLRKIKKDLKKKGWNIQKSFFNFKQPYHYFFILNSKNL